MLLSYEKISKSNIQAEAFQQIYIYMFRSLSMYKTISVKLCESSKSKVDMSHMNRSLSYI